MRFEPDRHRRPVRTGRHRPGGRVPPHVAGDLRHADIHQLLMCNPSGYEQSATALGRVASEVEQSTNGYQQAFARGASPPAWSGTAQQAADGYVQRSVEYAQRMARATVDAGTTLQGFAAELAAIVAQLRAVSTAATAQGFLINEGVVVIGPAQWAEISAAT